MRTFIILNKFTNTDAVLARRSGLNNLLMKIAVLGLLPLNNGE